MALQVIIKPKNFYVDESKPKIELLDINISNIEKDKQLELSVKSCSIIRDGDGYSVGEALESTSLVFDNPAYENWKNDVEIIDFVCGKLNAVKA